MAMGYPVCQGCELNPFFSCSENIKDACRRINSTIGYIKYSIRKIQIL